MGVDMAATCVLWVRACLNYEPLFSFLDELRADTRWRYWISENGIEVNTCDIGEDMGYTVTEVKIAFTMSHKALTSSEEDIK
jgi:hypothetical protein